MVRVPLMWSCCFALAFPYGPEDVAPSDVDLRASWYLLNIWNALFLHDLLDPHIGGVEILIIPVKVILGRPELRPGLPFLVEELNGGWARTCVRLLVVGNLFVLLLTCVDVILPVLDGLIFSRSLVLFDPCPQRCSSRPRRSTSLRRQWRGPCTPPSRCSTSSSTGNCHCVRAP